MGIRAEAQLRTPALDIRVPVTPQMMSADGRSLLVYELRLTNVGRADRAVSRIAVYARGAELTSWSGEPLKGVMARLGGEQPAADGRVIASGRQSVAFLALSVENAPVIDTLHHLILLSHPDSLTSPPRDTVHAFAVPVGPSAVLSVRAPLGAGPWMAANGPGNVSGHRRALIAVNGQARIAQRYATDWVKFGPDGKLWRGDSTKNENWYGYREPLLAVAPGTVVATKDSIPENMALTPNRAVPITLETVGGNYVIVDLGSGKFAFYAHLIPGSLRVKLGDKIRAGDVVGLLGNSGNSDAPHLHFHIGDAPTPLGAEGVPFVFDRFQLLGRSSNLMAPWVASEGPIDRRRSAVLQNQVVKF